MKRISYYSALLCILISPLVSLAQTETLTLDPAHTYILWRIKHLGFSTQAGKWYAKGTLTIDEKKPQDSKIDVTIDVAKIITGDPELDHHLKGPMFFGTAKYSTATFISDEVIMTGKDTAKVKGTLTLRGVSKPITLNVKLNKVGVNPISDKMTAGFSATAKIKRSDFGMTAFLPSLSDEVDLNIEAEAYKTK